MKNEPIRWREDDSDAPQELRDFVRTLSPTPPMPSVLDRREARPRDLPSRHAPMLGVALVGLAAAAVVLFAMQLSGPKPRLELSVASDPIPPEPSVVVTPEPEPEEELEPAEPQRAVGQSRRRNMRDLARQILPMQRTQLQECYERHGVASRTDLVIRVWVNQHGKIHRAQTHHNTALSRCIEAVVLGGWRLRSGDANYDITLSFRQSHPVMVGYEELARRMPVFFQSLNQCYPPPSSGAPETFEVAVAILMEGAQQQIHVVPGSGPVSTAECVREAVERWNGPPNPPRSFVLRFQQTKPSVSFRPARGALGQRSQSPPRAQSRSRRPRRGNRSEVLDPWAD